MADAALFIGFGNPVHGREARALEVFGETLAYYDGLQGDGSVESVQTVILEPHGGDLGGFVLLNGDAAKLEEIRRSDDFQRLMIKAGLIVENLGVISATTGDAVGGQMGIYAEETAALS